MKKKTKLIIIISLLLIIGIIIGVRLFSIYRYGPSSPHDIFSQSEQNRLKPGDIILRRGKSLASDLIVKLMNESIEVSHCALLVEHNDGWAVIHSVSKALSGFDGIQSDSLDYFMKHSQPDTTIVVRPKYEAAEIRNIIVKAQDLLKMKLPFDSSYKLDNGNNLYCSELFYEIFPDDFKRNGIQFSMGELIAFKTFIQPEYFEIIIDHRE